MARVKVKGKFEGLIETNFSLHNLEAIVDYGQLTIL